MAKIAAGKGRGPKPFMLAAKERGADAVWDSNKGLAAEARRQAPIHVSVGQGAPRPPKSVQSRLPDFIAPQLCQSVPRPPTGTGWLHEIKFDGYRVQLRVQNGKVTLKTRKGLDWTAKFASDRQKRPNRCPMRSSTARSCARRERRARFRCPAGGAIRTRTDQSGILRLRSPVRRRGRFAGTAAGRT